MTITIEKLMKGKLRVEGISLKNGIFIISLLNEHLAKVTVRMNSNKGKFEGKFQEPTGVTITDENIIEKLKKAVKEHHKELNMCVKYCS